MPFLPPNQQRQSTEGMGMSFRGKVIEQTQNTQMHTHTHTTNQLLYVATREVSEKHAVVKITNGTKHKAKQCRP